MAKHPWSTTEQIYLQEHYATMTVREIAAALGRNYRSVKGKVGYMGLTKTKPPKVKPPKPQRAKVRRRIPPGVRDYLLGYVASD